MGLRTSADGAGSVALTGVVGRPSHSATGEGGGDGLGDTLGAGLGEGLALGDGAGDPPTGGAALA